MNTITFKHLVFGLGAYALLFSAMMIFAETAPAYKIVSQWTMDDISYTLFDLPDGHRYLEAKYIKKPSFKYSDVAAVSVIHSPACQCHAK